MSNTLEAKICVLGAQGVGKTSLVQRYVKGTFTPPTTLSTVGASFLTKRATDVDSGTTVRLQVWDTAGQERFRSISKLYYRGASAVILVYSIVDERSFAEMGRWLREVKDQVGDDAIVHVVGTKSDVVARDPGARQIPFERCIAYVTEQLYPAVHVPATPPPPVGGRGGGGGGGGGGAAEGHTASDSKRSSGFWGQDVGWDTCHEISSLDGEGIDEVFRVITRKLVEQRARKLEKEAAAATPGGTPGFENGQGGGGYFDRPVDGGSFRVGHGDKRRSWLGFPTPSIGVGGGEDGYEGVQRGVKKGQGRCC